MLPGPSDGPVGECPGDAHLAVRHSPLTGIRLIATGELQVTTPLGAASTALFPALVPDREGWGSRAQRSDEATRHRGRRGAPSGNRNQSSCPGVVSIQET